MRWFKKGNGKRECVIMGAFGALLFSAIGAVIWLICFRFISSFLLGLIGMFSIILALIGYRLMANKISLKGIIISTVICALVLILAWHVGLARALYNYIEELYNAGELAYKITFYEALGNPYYKFDNVWGYGGPRVLSLLMCVGDCIMLGVAFACMHREDSNSTDEILDAMTRKAD